MTETLEAEELIARLHQMNGHRIALMRQFADGDAKDLLRVFGESVAFAGLIRGLEDYREDGDLGDPPEPERYAEYERLSRAMLRADDLAAVEPEPEAEGVSFQ